MMPDIQGMGMGLAMGGDDEGDIHAKLLENLMQVMDSRIAKSAMQGMGGKDDDAVVDVAAVAAPSANPDEDPELDDDMKQLIKSKRGY